MAEELELTHARAYSYMPGHVLLLLVRTFVRVRAYVDFAV